MTNQTITLTVLGMHCASCVKRVERALTAVKGVKTVQVSLLANQATVEIEADQTNAAELSVAVRRLGFQVPE